MLEVPTRGKLWILEDSPLEGELARRALAETLDVDLFTDGSVLLERAATTTMPDAIVLDWQLPGVTGLEVCRTLRANNDAMTLPLLMLTGHGQKADVLQALAAGANDYVTKPYDMSEVIARVATLVQTSRLYRAQKRRARQLALSADVGAALSKGKNLDEIGERVTLALTTHLDGLAVEIWVVRGGRLVLLASLVQGEASVPRDVIDEVAKTQVPFATDDVRSATPLSFGPGASGFAALPLVVRDETLGVVAICTSEPLGDAVAVLGTVADILALGIARTWAEDERVISHARERNSREEAEAANRSKDEFLAMVSHELRTPLNAITGWTTMLRSGGLEPDRAAHALEVIGRNARAQAQLIDDLLDINRIVSGQLRIDVNPVDVPSLAELTLESARLSAEAKGITLSAEIDATAGKLPGDAERIQQVISNLLTNAIKFTPKGGRVLFTLARGAAGIEISVEDNGQGIAPDFLPFVFDRFRQADGTLTRAKGGLGLGLAIVKHLVELHGGTIRAESEGTGKGSAFHVVLPTEGPAKHSPTSRAFAAARPGFERPRDVEGVRVLVVDDEEDVRELLRTLLESCKMKVTTAPNAADAFAAVRARSVDVVLSDISMPVEDGLSFIRRVRALSHEDGGGVPAVALTVYARLEDRARVLKAGFNSHVAKPVEPSELLAVLSSLAGR